MTGKPDPAPAPPVSAERIAKLRWRVHLNRHPSAVLLLVQLAGLLLYPFIEGRPAGNLLFGAFSVLVLCLAIAMVQHTRGRAWISVAIALPAVALNALHALYGLPALLPWAAGLEALFYFYAVWCLIDYMLADRRATTDELYAAGATFTLLAWAFAHVFVVCQYVQPHSFGAAMNADAPRTWTELLFLSFVLLSSTGIGDVTPLVPFARALACLEIFVGVMYLALIVSRLIGLTLIERDHQSEP